MNALILLATEDITISHQLFELLISIGVAGLLGKGGYDFYRNRHGGRNPQGTNPAGLGLSEVQLQSAIQNGCGKAFKDAIKPQITILEDVKEDLKDLCGEFKKFLAKEEARREMEMQLKIQKLGRPDTR